MLIFCNSSVPLLVEMKQARGAVPHYRVSMSRSTSHVQNTVRPFIIHFHAFKGGIIYLDQLASDPNSACHAKGVCKVQPGRKASKTCTGIMSDFAPSPLSDVRRDTRVFRMKGRTLRSEAQSWGKVGKGKSRSQSDWS